MSQINAPIHSYKNPVIYYSKWISSTKPKNFNRQYRLYLQSDVDSDFNLRSSIENWNGNCFSFSFSLEKRYENCLENCLENLAVQPNHVKPGGPNFPTNKKNKIKQL